MKVIPAVLAKRTFVNAFAVTIVITFICIHLVFAIFLEIHGFVFVSDLLSFGKIIPPYENMGDQNKTDGVGYFMR